MKKPSRYIASVSKDKSRNFTKAKGYCYRLLKFRPRSEKEIRERLKRKSFSEEIVAQAVEHLKKLNYINDKEFSLAWANSRITKNLGLRRIYFELKQKGIEKTIIDETLSAIKEKYRESQVIDYISKEKFEKMIVKTDPLKAKQRIYAFLLRRGFAPDKVSEALDKL